MAVRIESIDFTELRDEKRGSYMEGTRLWCFDDAKAWINGDQRGSFLFWLMGSAGTGKSVVSYTKLIELITRKEKPLVEADVAWHFCLHTNPADNTPFRIVSSRSRRSFAKSTLPLDLRSSRKKRLQMRSAVS